jgi:hypothetical protein
MSLRGSVSLFEPLDCAHPAALPCSYIRALAPRGATPTIALIGSRADRCAKPTALLAALRAQADIDGIELPELSAGFAFDCRGAAWPLRDWYVAQHDALVGMASPIPKPIEAIRDRKAAWSEASRTRILPWTEFCARLRREVPALAGADEHLMRAISFFLHDTGSILTSSSFPASEVVVVCMSESVASQPSHFLCHRTPVTPPLSRGLAA